MPGKNYLRILILLLLILSLPAAAQTNLEVFGQNRVQYKRFAWKYFEAKHFKIYHYDRAGADLARYVAEQAEQDVTAVENRLGNSFPDWLNIIIYNSYDDYQQSNIGFKPEGQIENNPAGTVDILGDKLTIYFTGDHADLRMQLRRGIATVMMEHMMFGDNLREMVRNAVVMNLPAWLTEGYIGYVVDGWTPDADNEWKNLTTTPDRAYFDVIAEQRPGLAGRAFWKYISERYGPNSVKNLLYLTQLKGSLNAALKLSYGRKEKQEYDSVIAYYQQLYQSQTQLFQSPDTSRKIYTIDIPKDGSRIRDIMISPRGFDIAYVQWNNGTYKVILQKTAFEEGKNATATILSGGTLNHQEMDDPDYPLLAWSNTGYKLGIIYNLKNRIRIKVYDAIKGKTLTYTVRASRFDRILSFTFMEDDDMILLSAIRKGKSDLFEYRLKGGRMTQLTDDIWDDLQPVFVSGGSRKGVVFLSNRPQPYINIQALPNELPAQQLNAFFYNSTTKSMDLLPITRLTDGNISRVIPYGFDNFAFLSDRSGVNNRYAVLFGRDVHNMDSAYSVPVTNYENSILYQQYNPASGKVADVIRQGNQYVIYFRNVDLPPPAGDAAPQKPVILPQIDALSEAQNRILFFDEKTTSNEKGRKQKSAVSTHDESWLHVKSGNSFQTDFEPVDTNLADSNPGINLSAQQFAQKLSIKNRADSIVVIESASGQVAYLDSLPQNSNGKRIRYVDSTYLKMKPQPYRLSFRPDFFSARIDNTIIFNRYQAYTGNGGQYSNPPLGGMFTTSLIDKMEDYRFTGGVRIPIDFSSMTYLLQFQNLRRRVDWGLTFLRNDEKHTYRFMIGSAQGGILMEEPGKTTMNMIQGDVAYPFNKVNSIRMQFGLREDRMIIKAQDPIGLALPSIKEYWAMSRVELVHDDTRNPTINIWNGLRFKLFVEYMYKLYSDNKYYQLSSGFDSTQLGGFYNLGLDIRYYKKIYKNFIGAIRVAGAHSGGNKQIMYILGGVDNSLRPDYSNAMPPSNKNTYAFQALETNLRGYPQNARNGNTFAVLNAELRFPIFGTLMRRPVRFTMLKHLQAVAFVDAGSAWEGLLPNEDRVRTRIAYWPDQYNSIVTVHIPVQTFGLAVGYGVGLRTMLFGYFVRADAAWNIERSFQFHVSLGTDF